MDLAKKLTIELIRYEIDGIPLSDVSLVTDAIVPHIYDFAFEQDVAYIVADALYKLNLLSEENKLIFFKEQLVTVYRYEQIKHELQSMYDLFETEKIPFIPLKGTVIRNYYPKPEMRTSCDIDILVHENDLPRVRKMLEDKLDYRYYTQYTYDVCMESPSGVNVEIHFRLSDHGEYESVLNKMWDYAHLSHECDYKHEHDDTFFMFYHIAHMARHVKSGGCGIRPFIDLHILNQKHSYDDILLEQMLEDSGLKKFYDVVLETSKVWFETGVDTPKSILMENYIFDAGQYGSKENVIATTNHKNGNRSKYIINIFLPSYKSMCNMYPSLKKCPVLLPFVHIYRWFASLFKGTYKRAISLFTVSGRISRQKQKDVAELFSLLEIN